MRAKMTRKTMPDYIEGKRPLVEALRTQVPMKRVLLADNAKRDGLIDDILRKAKRFEVPVITVPRKELDQKSVRGGHQGVMAEVKPFDYVDITVIEAAAAAYADAHDGRALVVLLDHLTDAGNLGAIARSAEVVGASGMVIPHKRSASVDTSTYKSSAGAIMHLPVAQVPNLIQVMARLKERGFWVAGASEHADEVIWKSNMKGKMALVMGNESEGLSRVVQESCDFLVKLPLEGEVASLNVAQASTACMYEWLRQNY